MEAALGPEGRFSELAARVREEGVAVLTAAGIPFASDAEDAERSVLSVEAAISNDTILTSEEKKALLAVYRSYLAAHA